MHIHVKVHLGGNVVHTGQLYFPDSVTDAVYKKAPYTNRPNRTTRNGTTRSTETAASVHR